MPSSTRRVALSSLLFAGLLAACPFRGQAQGIDDWLERAHTAQSSGNYAQAATLYARATALSPATAELWSNRGVMEYLAGQMDASEESLHHALRLNPNLFAPMLFLGKEYLQAGKASVALPYLNHAHALRPDDAEILITLGKTNTDLDRPRQAETAYASAVRLAPANATAWFGLGVASLDIITADGRDLAASQAKSVWARTLFADELFAQGRPLEAMDTYKTALAAASPAEKSTLARSVDWLQSHPDLFPLPANSQEALQRLDTQLKSEHDNGAPCVSANSPIGNAACAFWAGDYDRSAEQAGRVLRQSSHDAEALYWSVKARERIAVAALARFEELAPQSAASYVMVGDLYRDQRQMDSALSEYKKALAIDAHDPPALMGAVVAEISAGKLDEAAAIDQVALTDHPLDPQSNLLMAEILAARHEYDQVTPYLAKCQSAPPELQSRVHYLLGRAYSLEGKTQEAIRQFQLALPGDEDGSIHYQLSRVYRKTGNSAEAQKAEDAAKALIRKRYANAAIAVREETATTP